MRTVRELLLHKGNGPIHTIGPEDSVFNAVTRMVENNVGAILVTDQDRILGIMTERDYLRLITIKGRTARDTLVSSVMTRRVIYVTPETPLDDVMAIMTEQRIRHVPVLDVEGLLGIVSIGDVVKQISRNQQVQIKTLEEYIEDGYPGPGARQAQARA